MKFDYVTRYEQLKNSSVLLYKYRSVLRGAMLTLLATINKKQDNTFLRCLYCHYVYDDQREEFEHVIQELKKIGRFVDTATCIRMLRGEEKIDKRYFHLSFDDGFRNHFTNIVPILKKHNVPAIFFVPSSLIDADWDEARKYCILTKYKGVIEMLRWSDLREMVSMGFEIGSHTRNHARFSDISGSKALLKDEILGSKRDIEINIDYECKYISWPYGRLSDANLESLQMVADAGYKACFGAYRGTVMPGATNIYSIPRHHFEVNWPLSHILYFTRGNMEVKKVM
ncbi:MAG TPA: polysaccharide deacetylase family protein [Bacteroidetes bacterium]|nr:polysaccharide deacetylase family protein [Bacteroidota bacterium]